MKVPSSKNLYRKREISTREDTNHGEAARHRKDFFLFPVMIDKLELLIRKLKT